MKNWQTGSIIEAEDLNRYETAIQPATQQNDGILSKVDKVKLDGISEGAQKNPDIATLNKNGLMSATDKTKLDGISEGAQVNPIKANQSEAEAGTDDTKMMTPIRVKQSILKNTPSNAETATKLATARTIAISGEVVGTAQSFDGTTNKTIATKLSTGTDIATSDTYAGLMSLRKRGPVAILRVAGLTRISTNNTTNSLDEIILTVPSNWLPYGEVVGQFYSGEFSGKLRMAYVHLYTNGTLKVTSFFSSSDEAYTSFRPAWNGQITYLLPE